MSARSKRLHRAGVPLLAALLIASSWLTAASPAPARPDRAPEYPAVARQETVITDRFGQPLKAYLQFPAEAENRRVAGRFPVVLHYTYFPAITWEQASGPAMQQSWTAAGFNLAEGFERLTRRGYVVAQVAPPGTGGSGGGFTFNKDGRMALAGHDTVEWLAAQPWSNGKVGMFGGSGNGIAQLMTAATRPPHLVTIIPAVAYTDLYSEVIYRGGMFAAGDAVIIQALALGIYGWGGGTIPDTLEEGRYNLERQIEKVTGDRPEPYLAEWYSHPLKDSYWDAFTYQLDQIDIPVWAWGGWDDHFTQGAFNTYRGVPSRHRMLSIGYNGHSTGPDFDPIGQALRWFDLWLKGTDTTGLRDEMARNPVHYYVTGENSWKAASTWPPPSTGLTLHAGSGVAVPGATGTLSERLPAAEGSDRYAYTPAAWRSDNQNGFVAEGIPGLMPRSPNTDANSTPLAYNNPTGHFDQRVNIGSSVTYVSEPLTRDVEITGEPIVTLYSESTSSDPDWVVKLIDVFPETGGPAQPGYWDLASTGWLKGTHRNSDVRLDPVPPGQTVEYRIKMFPTSRLLRAGHRIALQISSADSRAVPNLNPAVNTVHHSPLAATRIEIPVVSR